MPAASDYKALAAKLRTLHASLAADSRAKVTCWTLGDPITDEDLAALGDGSLPEEAVALSRCFNGARLTWTWTCADGHVVRGDVRIADLETLQGAESSAPMEDERNWPLLYASHGQASLVDDAIYFFDDDGSIKGEQITVVDAIDALLDGLGLPGWDLRFWEHGLDEEEEAMLEDFESRVSELRAALNLPSL